MWVNWQIQRVFSFLQSFLHYERPDSIINEERIGVTWISAV